MSNRVDSLRLFTRVARTESFTAAGKEVGLSQPSASRIISNLEKELGAALFIRNTHKVKLTEIGEDYLARIDLILADLDEANQMVRGDGKLQGRLRVGVATSFAVRELIPRLPTFIDKHTDLSIDLVLADSRQDLIDDAIDVAIRFGPLKDSTMVARKLGVTKRLLAASPGYLSRAGTPQTPSDLVGHSVILGPSSTGSTGWTFSKNGKSTSIRVESKVSVSVNEGTTAAALSGMGIVSTAFSGCRTELENGNLIQLLPDWDIGTVEINAVLAGGRKSKTSARTFVDYLVASFRNIN